jgi:hypothetical protein
MGKVIFEKPIEDETPSSGSTLNTNTTQTTESSSAAESIVIGGVDYTSKAEVGYVLKDTLTEELNSLVLVIKNISKHLFEPFTRATVTLKDGKTYQLCVNTQQEKIFNASADKYSYVLELLSSLKFFERIYLPNLKIRYISSSPTKLMYDYIDKVLLRYVRQYFSINVSSHLQSLLSNVYCPELEWKEGMNVKQAINELLSTIPNNPCLVTINSSGELDYVSLSQKNNNIRTAYPNVKFLLGNSYQTMTDYANSLVSDVKNIVGTNNRVVEVYTSLRARNSATLDTNNADLILPYPIEEISTVQVKVKMTRTVGSTTENFDNWLNITRYILEENDYKALSQDWTNTERSKHLYYTHGQNVIKGFNETYKLLILTGASALENICNDAKPGWSYSTSQDIRDIPFQVLFVPIANARVEVTKTEQEENDVSLYQSQNKAALNLRDFEKVQQQQVDRLGNEVKEIPMICPLNEIPVLGDYLDDNWVMCQREVAFYNDYAICKGTFAKNFAIKQIYYGIQARKKYTQLAQANESVIREEFRKVCTTYSTDEITDSNQMTNITLFNLFWWRDLGIKQQLRFLSLSTYNIVNGISENICSEVTLFPAIIPGNRAVTVTAQCEDNYQVGMQVVDDGGTRRQKYVRYTDSYGQFDRYTIAFQYLRNGGYPSVNIDTLRALPNASMSTDVRDAFYMLSLFYKDNGETLKFTYQQDYVGDGDKVVVGDAIGKLNIYTGSSITAQYLYISTTERVDKYCPIINTSLFTRREITSSTITVNGRAITFNGLDTTNLTCYAIADFNGEVILAVNKVDGVLPTTIYASTKTIR